jgi:CBS domain-containing protein
MVDRRLQNVPVLNDEARPVGVLDIRDALRAMLAAEEYQEQQLVNYVSGIGYR